MPQTKIQGKFYPLTASIAEALRKAKLSAAEWRIWSYLVQLNPFGDRYTDFDYLSVMSICECSKTTMWRAFTKFQEFNIFDFQSRGICVRTLTGASQLRKPDPETDPPKSDSQPKTKPKPKTSERPKTIEPPILRKKTSEPTQPPETSEHPSPPTNDYPEVSDPWDDLEVENDRPETSDRPDPISEMKSEFQNCNNDFKNEISVSKMKPEFQNCNNEGLKHLSDIASLSPQTLQRKLDPPVQPDGGVEQSKFQEEEVNENEQVTPKSENLTQNEQVKSKESKAQNEQIKANETTLDTRKEKDVPRDVVQEKTEVTQKTANKRLSKEELPIDLVERLEQVDIPLDDLVLTTIANHHISQAYGACTHVENTFDTIRNPRAVFLYQIPKQKIEQMGQRIPEIGKQMREENAAIEEEMATEEYQKTAREAFAKMREKLGRGGKK